MARSTIDTLQSYIVRTSESNDTRSNKASGVIHTPEKAPLWLNQDALPCLFVPDTIPCLVNRDFHRKILNSPLLHYHDFASCQSYLLPLLGFSQASWEHLRDDNQLFNKRNTSELYLSWWGWRRGGGHFGFEISCQGPKRWRTTSGLLHATVKRTI